MATTRSGFALKKFTDAGNSKSYNVGEEIKNLDEGMYLNYERAGLVGDKAAVKEAETTDKAAKPAA